MPPVIQGGAIGPPIPLREQLELYNLKQKQLLKGESSVKELLELQEKADDTADEYGIHLMWFGTHVALYGRFNGVFRLQ